MKIKIDIVQQDVTNVIFVKKYQIFLLNCNIVTIFYPKASLANNQDKLPNQPFLWHAFNSVINKNNKNFLIEIAKSISYSSLVLNYGKIC